MGVHGVIARSLGNNQINRQRHRQGGCGRQRRPGHHQQRRRDPGRCTNRGDGIYAIGAAMAATAAMALSLVVGGHDGSGADRPGAIDLRARSRSARMTPWARGVTGVLERREVVQQRQRHIRNRRQWRRGRRRGTKAITITNLRRHPSTWQRRAAVVANGAGGGGRLASSNNGIIAVGGARRNGLARRQRSPCQTAAASTPRATAPPCCTKHPAWQAAEVGGDASSAASHRVSGHQLWRAGQRRPDQFPHEEGNPGPGGECLRRGVARKRRRRGRRQRHRPVSREEGVGVGLSVALATGGRAVAAYGNTVFTQARRASLRRRARTVMACWLA